MNSGPPSRVVPVVLAGGSGTRLWPVSRALHPKQYLSLDIDSKGDVSSLFQLAVKRVAALDVAGCVVSDPIVVANEQHRFTVLEQLRTIDVTPARLLLEPTGRGTAPAVTLAALEALGSGLGDPILVVTPADHSVTDAEACTFALGRAVVDAAIDGIFVFGILPTGPDTGYGYIRAEGGADEFEARPVRAFVEKPVRATAERFLAQGDYFWNSGIFVMRASLWLSTLQRFRPDIAQAAKQAAESANKSDLPFLRYDAETFEAIPAESIDVAVMESASQPRSGIVVRMVRLDAGWSDLGAWDAIWRSSPHDDAGNATQGDAIVMDSRDTLVHASSRLVSVIGLDSITVVETSDAVLVAHRSQSALVRELVAVLDRDGRREALRHRRVSRPWGWYESIDEGPRFQVKRIMVRPGARLSLQLHHHRAEHWIVVTGTAEVTKGTTTTLVSENESTYIPVGQKHRLGNPGRVPLELIEVQSGSYLGEDDIVRFEDNYGRN